jgi:hypothetical protein
MAARSSSEKTDSASLPDLRPEVSVVKIVTQSRLQDPGQTDRGPLLVRWISGRHGQNAASFDFSYIVNILNISSFF